MRLIFELVLYSNYLIFDAFFFGVRYGQKCFVFLSVLHSIFENDTELLLTATPSSTNKLLLAATPSSTNELLLQCLDQPKFELLGFLLPLRLMSEFVL